MVSLRKWNDLQTDAISVGQKLIVGFLVTPETAVAKNNGPEIRDYAKLPDEKEVKKEEKPIEKKEPEKKNRTAKDGNNCGY